MDTRHILPAIETETESRLTVTRMALDAITTDQADRTQRAFEALDRALDQLLEVPEVNELDRC